MRVLVRNAIDLTCSCLAAVSVVLNVFLDASLLSVARSRTWQHFEPSNYRPVYTRFGRKNRASI